MSCQFFTPLPTTLISTINNPQFCGLPTFTVEKCHYKYDTVPEIWIANCKSTFILHDVSCFEAFMMV